MQSRLGQDDLVGQTVSGRYEVFAKLGQGGMGVVYAARQAPLGRTVAIKVLLKEMTADPVAASRFEKEALAISRLSHPNIVTIFDFGSTDAGHKFIAMEFLDGKSLREIVARESPLSPKRTTRILMYMARALADAHRQEIIHRDLKPDNIMVLSTTGEPDFVKVLDFGVAKLKRREGEVTQATVTQEDVILGTPKYMSPEQINGITDDPRSDLYAMGAIAYEMLTGKVPFDGDSPVKVLMKHLTDAPPPMRSVFPACRVSDVLEALVLQLLHKDASKRPQSAKRVLELLEDLPEYTGPRSRLMTVAGMQAVTDLPAVPPASPVVSNPANAAPLDTAHSAAPVNALANGQEDTGPEAPQADHTLSRAPTRVGPAPEDTQASPPPRFAAVPTQEVDSVFTHTRLPPVFAPGQERASSSSHASATPAVELPVAPDLTPEPMVSLPGIRQDVAVAGPRSMEAPTHVTRPATRTEHQTQPAADRGTLTLFVGAAVLTVGVLGLGAAAWRAFAARPAPPAPVPVTAVEPAPPPPAPTAVEPVASSRAELAAGNAQSAAAVVPAPAPSPAPSDPAPTPPRAEDPTPKKARLVTVTVTSVPAGATVLEGTNELGTTPLALQWPKATSPRVLTVRLAGFKDEVRGVRPDRSRAVPVKLLKAPRTEPTKDPGHKEPGPKEEPKQPTPVATPKDPPPKDPAPAPKVDPAPRKDPVKFEKWDDLKDPGFGTK